MTLDELLDALDEFDGPIPVDRLKEVLGRATFTRADVADRLHFSEGHLTRRQKEMIATYVSALNQCLY